ncbi:hypothetical protein ACJX0J_007636, partial [Zea mays]
DMGIWHSSVLLAIQLLVGYVAWININAWKILHYIVIIFVVTKKYNIGLVIFFLYATSIT